MMADAPRYDGGDDEGEPGGKTRYITDEGEGLAFLGSLGSIE